MLLPMSEQQKPKRPKAYSYIRMSTEGQLQGDSLRRQTDRSRQYALEHGLARYLSKLWAQGAFKPAT
jgi:hypothetical protein